jgi:hypothetical protein
MKEKAYKKEIMVTIVFIILYMLMGHTAAIFVLFPGLQVGTMWGFPIHYIVPVLTGWFGMIVLRHWSATSLMTRSKRPTKRTKPL